MEKDNTVPHSPSDLHRSNCKRRIAFDAACNCCSFTKCIHRKVQVIIDVRNVYETAIGHFNPKVTPHTSHLTPHTSHLTRSLKVSPGCSGAAQLVDPKMRQSTDFPGWLQVGRHRMSGIWLKSRDVQEASTQEQLQGKDVLMYKQS
jgi:hypothetical protein